MKARPPGLDRAFKEVFENPPKVTLKTRRAKGPEAARKQKIAIALNKARAAGVKIPKPKV